MNLNKGCIEILTAGVVYHYNILMNLNKGCIEIAWKLQNRKITHLDEP